MKKVFAAFLFGLCAVALRGDVVVPTDSVGIPCTSLQASLTSTAIDLNGWQGISFQVTSVAGSVATVTVQKRNSPTDQWSDPVITVTNPGSAELGYDGPAIGQIRVVVVWTSGTLNCTVTRTKAATAANYVQWPNSWVRWDGGTIFGLGYTTILNDDVAVTQRSKLNIVGGGCVDNAGTSSTDCTLGGGGGGAPTDATYITQTANGSLSNEQAMGSLGTGLVFNTTTTGVQSIYTGTSCTNQFPRSLSAAGAATCQSISLGADTAAGSATSAELAGILSNESGSGLAVFNTLPRFVGLQTDNGSTGGGFIDFFEDSDGGSNKLTLFLNNTIAADRTLGIPAITADDTLMTLNATQTADNKTFTTPSVTEGSTGPGYLKFLEDSDNGSQFIRITGQSSVATNRNFTIPALSADDTIVGEAQTQTLTNKTLTSPTIATPTISGAITFPDDVRQTFNPGTTNAGLNVGSIAGAPSAPSAGDIWYDSDCSGLRAYATRLLPSVMHSLPDVFFEDFMGPINTTIPGVPNSRVNQTNTGTGAGGSTGGYTGGTSAFFSRPGIPEFDVGTSGTGSVQLNTGQNNFRLMPCTYIEFSMGIVTLPSSGNYFIRGGFSDSTSTTGADGTDELLVEYTDNVNSGKLVIHSCNNTACSDTNGTGAALVADTMYRIGILMNAAANSSEVFQDGVSIGTKSSDLPIGNTQARRAGFLWGIFATTANTSQSAVVDYILIDPGVISR